MPRHFLFAVGVAALSAAGGAPVRAADLPRKAPPLAAPAWTWDGIYLGAHAGSAWAHDPIQSPLFAGPSVSVGDINSNGGLAGFQAGANWQNGRWVAGLEVDISATTAHAVSSAAGAGLVAGVGPGTGSLALGEQIDMLSSGRVRLGWLPRPDLLLYATGGLAWSRADTSTDQTQTVAGLGTTVSSVAQPGFRFGWAAGGGAELRLMNTNWLGRVEYLHYDFGDAANATSTTIAGGATGTSVASAGPLTVDVLRAGLSYKFGGGGGPAAGWTGAGPFAWAPSGAPSGAAASATAWTSPWRWDGFYVGAHAGYGWASDRVDQFFGDTAMHGVDAQGALGGVQAGANWQRGRLVGGLEIDASATDIHGQNSAAGTSVSPFITTTASGTAGDAYHMLSSARARFGYLITPTTLLYGTGGLAWTEFQRSGTTDTIQTLLGPTTTETISNVTSPSWRFGWVAGFGAEQRIGATNWIERLEYLHYDFGETGSISSTVSNAGVTTVTPLLASDHMTVDVLRAGASYRLGGGSGAAPAQFAAAEAPTSWNGFYLGVHGGGGLGRDPFSTTGGTPAVSDVHASGWVAGGQAGANWQTGRWLAGLETDVSGTGIRGSSSATLEIPGSAVGETIGESFELLGSARARLGWLPWPNLLVYGTGGLAWAQVLQTINSGSSGSGFVSTITQSAESWRWGWAAGLGAETRIGHGNWLGRVEYLHYDFGKGFAQSAVSAGSATVITEGVLTADVIRAGVSYQLN